MAVIAAEVICVPLIGALEMSLPPCVVPTEAEVALVKVGVRLTVAAYNGLVDDAVMEAALADTKLTMVVAVLLPSSFEAAVMVTLPTAAGAVQVPVLLLMAPPVADHVIPLVAPPVVKVVNVVVLFTVRVGAAGLTAFTTTVCGVTVTELSTKSPAALVARNQ